MYMDIERIRELTRREYRHELEAHGHARPGVVEDTTTALILQQDGDVDVEQLLRAEIRREIAVQSKRRSKATRQRLLEVAHDAEGVRYDTPFEQLSIFQGFQVAERKIEHGEASVAEGLADRAVAEAARAQALHTGMPLTSKIGDLLSSDQIVAIRTEAKRAA